MTQSNNLYTPALIHQLPCGVISFTDDGIIRFVNNTLLKELQYMAEDIEGQHIETMLSLPSRIFYQTHFFPLIKLRGQVEEIFLTLKTKDAREIPVLVYGSRTPLSGEQWITNCVVAPVWQRQKYEQEILQAKKQAEKTAAENIELVHIQQQLEAHARLLDRQVVRLTQNNNDFAEFGKVISHDLQEPIRKISLFINAIRHTSEIKGEKANEFFSRIDASLKRLIKLTQCLEQYVSLSNTNEQPQEISLSEIVTNSRELAVRALDFHDFEMDIAPLPRAQVYPLQIRQLFFELIKNAIQHRDKNRKLHIAVQGVVAQYNDFRVQEDRYKYIDFVRLEFSDNAMGFDSQYSQYVFQMFKQLQFEGEGIGFGLALCKKIVDNHFGTITCHSTAGYGTTFVILLPASIQDVKMIG